MAGYQAEKMVERDAIDKAMKAIREMRTVLLCGSEDIDPYSVILLFKADAKATRTNIEKVRQLLEDLK